MSPIQAGYLERVEHSIFDSVAVAPGRFEKQIMFQDPVSTSKPPSETNMLLSGMLPAPRRAIVHRLRFELVEGKEDDLKALRQFGLVTFRVGYKPYYDQPLSSLFFDAEMLKAVLAFTGDEESKNFLREEASKGMRFITDQEVVIEQQQWFSVDVWSTGNLVLQSPLKFRIYLQGYLFREVA